MREWKEDMDIVHELLEGKETFAEITLNAGHHIYLIENGKIGADNVLLRQKYDEKEAYVVSNRESQDALTDTILEETDYYSSGRTAVVRDNTSKRLELDVTLPESWEVVTSYHSIDFF